MGFRKIEADGYILGVAKTHKGNITEAEYNEISQIIRAMPVPPDGYRYRLKTNLTWELYEVQTINESEEEIPDSEALAIIMGGSA